MKTKNFLPPIVLLITLFASCEDDNKFISPSLNGLTMDVEVGGPNQSKHVFVNLFDATQTSIERSSWDLGFYSGDSFRVIINPSAEALVRELSINDLTQVNDQDTLGFGAMLSLDAIFSAVLIPPPPAWVSESINWVDDPSGDLAKTAVSEISSVADNNNVYIMNRGKTSDGTSRGWVKFRVIQEGNRYAVQYAPIASTSFETSVISKDENFNFSYFNFEQGITEVEPPKTSWDISFNTNIQILNFGVDFPYRVNDFVTINRNETSIAELILTTEQTLVQEYEELTLPDAQSLSFKTDVNAIGSNWRTVASPTPGSVTAVKSDRFYVIKNSNGDYFKLIFTAMLNESGERGYPQIMYKVIQ